MLFKRGNAINFVIERSFKSFFQYSRIGSDYVINTIVLSGVRGKIIVSTTHFLVVERSYFKYCVKVSFAANFLKLRDLCNSPCILLLFIIS